MDMSDKVRGISKLLAMVAQRIQDYRTSFLMNQKLLKYGISDGKEVHISNVESGLKCNCRCPCCNAILNAKKGKSGKQQEHFAHYKLEQCEHAYETSLHYSAKKLIEREGYITLPYREKKFNNNLLSEFFQPKKGRIIGNVIAKKYSIKNIKSEKKLHNIIPDIQAQISGRDILIEIAVTSKVKEEKFEKLKAIGIPTIEVDLSKLDYDFEEEELELILFQSIRKKKWIFNPKEDAIIEELVIEKNQVEKEVMKLVIPLTKKGNKNNTLINDCPLLKNYKYKSEELYNCRKCPYLVSEYEYNILCGYTNFSKITEIIEQKNEEFKTIV